MVDVNLNGGKCILLIVVCCKGYLYIVEKLIGEGVDVNEIFGDDILFSVVC